MAKTVNDIWAEEFLSSNDQSFNVGSVAALEALEECLMDWRAQILMRIAPRWFIRKIVAGLTKPPSESD